MDACGYTSCSQLPLGVSVGVFLILSANIHVILLQYANIYARNGNSNTKYSTKYNFDLALTVLET